MSNEIEIPRLQAGASPFDEEPKPEPVEKQEENHTSLTPPSLQPGASPLDEDNEPDHHELEAATHSIIFAEQITHPVNEATGLPDNNGLSSQTIIICDNSSVENPGHSYLVSLTSQFITANKGFLLLNHNESVNFQSGPISQSGQNGLTNEALLTILIDRTTKLDNQLPSEYNKRALEHLRLALESFESRTRDRIERGVESKLEA